MLVLSWTDPADTPLAMPHDLDRRIIRELLYWPDGPNPA